MVHVVIGQQESTVRVALYLLVCEEQLDLLFGEVVHRGLCNSDLFRCGDDRVQALILLLQKLSR